MTLKTTSPQSQHSSKYSRIKQGLGVLAIACSTAACCLALATTLTLLPAHNASAEKSRPVTAPPPSVPATAAPISIEQGSAKLPPPVAEMRDAILAAARTGNLDELLIPIQWNELPPNFGESSIKDTIAEWKKSSPDGTGRQWLALLINLLEAPYAVVRQGRDVENAKIYIWPAFAEVPLTNLPPTLDVEFLRLVTGPDAQRMKTAGYYDGYGIAIGADGTWHAFTKTAKAPKASK